MRSKAILFPVVTSVLLLLMAAVPYVLEFSSPISLSSQTPDFEQAIKPKLLHRATLSTLDVAFHSS